MTKENGKQKKYLHHLKIVELANAHKASRTPAQEEALREAGNIYSSKVKRTKQGRATCAHPVEIANAGALIKDANK